MASRVELPPIPSWLAVLPMLFSRSARTDSDQMLNSALAAASAALAADSERRDSRSRICFLLADLSAQYAIRTGDCEQAIPVNRAQLARASAIGLTRVKRILGFLTLSGVIEEGQDSLRILDWQRLCTLASYDRARLPMDSIADEEEELNVDAPLPRETRATVSGDPASFV